MRRFRSTRENSSGSAITSCGYPLASKTTKTLRQTWPVRLTRSKSSSHNKHAVPLPPAAPILVESLDDIVCDVDQTHVFFAPSHIGVILLGQLAIGCHDVIDGCLGCYVQDPIR